MRTAMACDYTWTWSDRLISVIIVTWNGRQRIGECLSSLQRDLPGADVIVVDNGSVDGTSDYVTHAFPGARLLRNSTNRGFSVACNQAALLSTRPLLLFFNDDAVWLSADFPRLDVFVRSLAAQDVIGFKLLDRSMRPYASAFGKPTLAAFLIGQFWLPRRLSSSIHRSEAVDPNGTVPVRAYWVEGSAFAIPRATFMQVGGFDEAFTPAYYEEVDLFRRLHRIGSRTFWVPFVTARHDGGASSGSLPIRRRRQMIINKAVQYHVKWGGWRARVSLACVLPIAAMWNLLYSLVRSVPRGSARTVASSVREGAQRGESALLAWPRVMVRFPPQQLPLLEEPLNTATTVSRSTRCGVRPDQSVVAVLIRCQ